MKIVLTQFLLFPIVALSQIQYQVVPNALETVPGNGSASVPFHVPIGSARYQQVFDAAQFSGLGPAGAIITNIAFRADEGGQSFNTTLPDIQISLSTTTKVPDSLSPVFAANIGANETIVYGRGSLHIRTAGPAGPSNFDIVVPLSNPFFYQPAIGNLLLDVRNFAGGGTTFFDAQVTLGDSISGVQAYTGDGSGSVNSTMGGTHTGGLVTLFEFTPVPEPGTPSLLIVSVAAFTLVYWMKTRLSRKWRSTQP